MCFSAHASFTAGAVLLGIGVAALRKTTKPSQRPFAAIPVVFSVQQFLEGLLWVSLENEAFAWLYTPAMYLFLFVAIAFWPLWLPAVVWLLEEVPDKKRALRVPLALGLATSVFYLGSMFVYGARANVDCYHVQYTLGYPLGKYFEAVYVLAAIAPFFIASWKGVWAFGATLLLSLAVTLILNIYAPPYS